MRKLTRLQGFAVINQAARTVHSRRVTAFQDQGTERWEMFLAIHRLVVSLEGRLRALSAEDCHSGCAISLAALDAFSAARFRMLDSAKRMHVTIRITTTNIRLDRCFVMLTTVKHR